MRLKYKPCASPDCNYPANDDASISTNFCCEKCEGRFNGEDWALNSAKRKKEPHTKLCTSRWPSDFLQDALTQMDPKRRRDLYSQSIPKYGSYTQFSDSLGDSATATPALESKSRTQIEELSAALEEANSALEASASEVIRLRDELASANSEISTLREEVGKLTSEFQDRPSNSEVNTLREEDEKLSSPLQSTESGDPDNIAAWLRSLDDGHGSMLQFLESFRKEFSEKGWKKELAAFVSPGDLRGSNLKAIDPILFETLGVNQLGFKLVLARGILKLPSRPAQ